MNHELEHSIENLVVELLARLHDSRQGDRGVAILVTSARPEEGKSFVAEAIARYAVTLLGGKVLLVDANPDHPTLHERFSLPLHPGLIDSLGDAAGAKLPIHENVTPGLDVMTAGGVGPTILFLRKEALASLVEACTSRYPLTVIDGSVRTRIDQLKSRL
jgi:Mrp family chromosome partitioning ATPase